MSVAANAKLLEGTKVLEVGNGIAVGYGGRVLRSLGAEIWKVEAANDPDWVRSYGLDCPQHAPLSCAGCHLNGSKSRFLVEQAGDGAALELLRNLMGSADITIVGTGALADRIPEALEDSRLEAASVVRVTGSVDDIEGLQINPDESAGVAAGLRDLYGDERPPSGQRFDIAEVNAGTHVAATVSMALASREFGNQAPVRVDVGVYESAFSMIEIGAQTLLLAALYEEGYPDILISPLAAPYPCADGRQLVINLYGKDVWKRMTRVMERPDMEDDERFLTTVSMWSHGYELRAILEDWCITLDRDEAVSRMRAQRIPCAPIYELDELLRDEHTVARGIITDDGAHSTGNIGSCYMVNGERFPLPFIDAEAAAATADSLGLSSTTATPVGASDAILVDLR